MTEADWRRRHRVLVTDAHAMGSIGVIRSLGRAGYDVIAASSSPAAIGLRSKFARQTMISPKGDEEGDSRLREWLAHTIESEAIDAVVPSESVLLAVRARYDAFRRFLPFSESKSVVFTGMSKFDVYERLGGTLSTDRTVPRTVLLRDDETECIIDALSTFAPPVFVKVDAIHAKGSGPSRVLKFGSIAAAVEGVPALFEEYDRVLVQEYAPGVGVGVFILRWRGRVLARFMHRRIHEVPHTGGASSYRMAWWNEDLYHDAVARLDALEWQGVAMLEYRWNPESGEFRFLELNGRFWGSLHLALYAGVDFPALLLDAFFGHERHCDTYDLTARSRWTFPREVEYVWSRIKDRDVALASRTWSLLEFFMLGFDPRTHSDLNFPGDRMLYLHGIRQSLERWARR
jgi:predicted ATP-grasp superfamily ATP-dependent carboligase